MVKTKKQYKKKFYREEKATVLDYLPEGYSSNKKRKSHPIVQAIGNKYFVLFNLIPRENVRLKFDDEVYIGQGDRKKIKTIRGIIDPSNLTKESLKNLKKFIKKIGIENIVRRRIVKKRGMRIIEHYKERGVNHFIINYNMDRNERIEIEEFFSICGIKVEITNPWAINRLENIRKGLYFQH